MGMSPGLNGNFEMNNAFNRHGFDVGNLAFGKLLCDRISDLLRGISDSGEKDIDIVLVRHYCDVADPVGIGAVLEGVRA